MSTHNICFYGELTKIILQLSSNTLLICPSTVHSLNLVPEDKLPEVNGSRLNVSNYTLDILAISLVKLF